MNRDAFGTILLLAALMLSAPMAAAATYAAETTKRPAVTQSKPAAATPETLESAKQLRSLQQQLKELKRTTEAQAKELATVREGMNEQTTKVETSEKKLSELESTGARSAWFLLIGLFAEILGAILLITSLLAKEQVKLFTLRPAPPLHDLALEDDLATSREAFLGIIGTSLLFLGFYLEYVGTHILLGFPWHISIAVLVIGLAVPLWVIYFLVGFTSTQTRREKLTIFFGNVNRLFVAPVVAWIQNKPVCDICNQSLNADDGTVAYLWEENLPGYEYLHGPYDFHFGHDKCLEQVERYDLSAPMYRDSTRVKLHKLSIPDFFAQVPRLRAWFTEYRKHWTERRNTECEPTRSESDFEAMVSRLSRFAPPKVGSPSDGI